DPAGLVALWREGLLAQKVLLGQTKGYRAHPQLMRFAAMPDPVLAIGCYLSEVVAEAGRRGYRFDATKIVRTGPYPVMRVTTGQMAYEWTHLLTKLSLRSPTLHEKRKNIREPDPHPLFAVVPGPVEDWERV
ncbi:MAG TPA: pyrimidine dimer DNA glycosylase/endonuclease V, partial [Noviherbaspirillum sp.]|nr:pyrimidine dimer DNA glycosylase/endonuclease V [Noviherbaspirillum sp.]